MSVKMTKQEEIEAYKEEIRVFEGRLKNALMPSRLRNEYDMMIDRLNTLLKELTNEKDLAVLNSDDATDSVHPLFVGASKGSERKESCSSGTTEDYKHKTR